MENEKAKEIERLFNCFPISKMTIEDVARHAHKTIQQNITRFCIGWLKYLGTNDVSIDGRNEDGVKIAQDLMKIDGVEEVLNRPVPYI